VEITEFEWDDSNVEHIFRHNVSPDEVEDVAFDDEPWIKMGGKEHGICSVIPPLVGIFSLST
jgi:uncharacterized DUF497 family protein